MVHCLLPLLPMPLACGRLPQVPSTTMSGGRVIGASPLPIMIVCSTAAAARKGKEMGSHAALAACLETMASVLGWR